MTISIGGCWGCVRSKKVSNGWSGINFHYSGPQKTQLVDPEFKIQVTRRVQNIQTRVRTPCIENKHFFTKSCHRHTYQNYEQPPQSLQNLYFQSHFSASNINQIFLIFFFREEYLTRRSTLIFKVLCFLKMCPIFVSSVDNFGMPHNVLI